MSFGNSTYDESQHSASHIFQDIWGRGGGERERERHPSRTGLGSQREGDLMSGTVAAAEYCWEIGPDVM